MSHDRRDFLQRLALGATVVGFPSALSASPTSSVTRSTASSPGRAFAAELEHDSQTRAQDWDTSWTQKITGKHRAVFDAPELEDGVGVMRAGIWDAHYRQVLKVQKEDISKVVVIRHNAIPLAMTDDFWREYELGKKHKIVNPFTNKRLQQNPVLMTQADGIPAGLVPYMLEPQMNAGTIVLACNLAFGEMVDLVSKKHKLQGAEARTKALAGLKPGVMLQPSGIFAVIMAQEAGCQFVRAS